MGSLDDAIREHLELKRQRGASDDEVKRQEEEAFGRGRRPAPDDTPVEDRLADDQLAADQIEAAEPQSNGQPADHGETAGTIDPEPFEPDEVPLEDSLQPEVTVRDVREDPREAHDEPAGPWDREDGGEDEEPASDAHASDPLEETPEFLEGSPEEDRLWFEQRPPKDFDLD